MQTMLLLAGVLVSSAPEFQPDPRYRPTPGETALLHATAPTPGRPVDVVLGRDESTYLRHLDREFTDSMNAFAVARSEKDLIILPYGTEVMVERVVQENVVAGRRSIARRLLAVHPVHASSGEASYVVLETHVQRPLDPAVVAARERDRYERYQRALRQAEEQRQTRWAAWRQAQDDYEARRSRYLESLGGSAPVSPMGIGTGSLTLQNLGSSDVWVTLEGDLGQFRLDVEAGRSRSIRLGNGRYKVLFRFADEPDAVFSGDSIHMNQSYIRLTLGADRGNYPIRRVENPA
jgi:hypothetical protein